MKPAPCLLFIAVHRIRMHLYVGIYTCIHIHAYTRSLGNDIPCEVPKPERSECPRFRTIYRQSYATSVADLCCLKAVEPSAHTAFVTAALVTTRHSSSAGLHILSVC